MLRAEQQEALQEAERAGILLSPFRRNDLGYRIFLAGCRSWRLRELLELCEAELEDEKRAKRAFGGAFAEH